MMGKWYAVQVDRTDAWDNGSHYYNEAVRMLEEQGHGLIAVIDEESGVCVEEIGYNDVVGEESMFEYTMRDCDTGAVVCTGITAENEEDAEKVFRNCYPDYEGDVYASESNWND